MNYNVIIPKSVQKEIDKLANIVSKNILEEIAKLQYNPRPVNCKKLSGRDVWRIRVGNYRIIYEIDDKEKTITLFRARHRREVYR